MNNGDQEGINNGSRVSTRLFGAYFLRTITVYKEYKEYKDTARLNAGHARSILSTTRHRVGKPTDPPPYLLTTTVVVNV